MCGQQQNNTFNTLGYVARKSQADSPAAKSLFGALQRKKTLKLTGRLAPTFGVTNDQVSRRGLRDSSRIEEVVVSFDSKNERGQLLQTPCLPLSLSAGKKRKRQNN